MTTPGHKHKKFKLSLTTKAYNDTKIIDCHNYHTVSYQPTPTTSIDLDLSVYRIRKRERTTDRNALRQTTLPHDCLLCYHTTSPFHTHEYKPTQHSKRHQGMPVTLHSTVIVLLVVVLHHIRENEFRVFITPSHAHK